LLTPQTAATKSGARKQTLKPPKDRQFVTALARGLQILSCFSATQPQLSGSEIATLTGLPQPTVWRLCHTMLALGMLITTSGDKMRPGLPVLRLGHSALAGFSALEFARPHMQDLADRYGGACGIATRDSFDMLFLERCESNNQLVLNLRRGSTVPVASSAFGWAYLAGLSCDDRAELIAEIQSKDPKQWSSVSKHFEKALAEFEAQGFVLNEGVFHGAYNTVATPVFGANGKIIFCLNCGAASDTLSVKTLRKEVAPKLVALARMLESVS
jgi:DNA-binding IclR family transcriptional regulator